MWTLAVALSLLLLTPSAQARTHHRHHQASSDYYSQHPHHFGRYLAERYRRHIRRGYATTPRQRHRDVGFSVGVAHERLDDGQIIKVASKYAERFSNFFHEVFEQIGVLPKDVTCQAWGHMPNSKHHWGGACDLDQFERNVTHYKPAYNRLTKLAEKWGLTDGCVWGGRGRYGGPDCGHIEVNLNVSNVSALAAKRERISTTAQAMMGVLVGDRPTQAEATFAAR